MPMRSQLAIALLLLAGFIRAEESPETRVLAALQARPIGPANMSGRVTDLAVVESRPATMYVGTASGGLWKTVNAGATWVPLFDEQAVLTIGDVTVAPSNPDVVWVGTGEANARNSVTWGDGVYKSTDAGRTWKHMGLRDSHHISRIVIHPQDPDIVYVAVMGHFWGPSKERGIYRTTDGGASWQRLTYLDADTGFIDLAMSPDDPNTLYGCAYRVRRDAFSGGNPAIQFSPLAGLYKSTDAGSTWVRLTRGLPDRPLGRCGIDICRSQPNLLYAVVQTDRTRQVRADDLGQGARAADNAEIGGIFKSEDRGATWVKVNDLCPRPFYFGQVRVDPNDPKRLYVAGVRLHVSSDGGRIFRADAGENIHADHHALWINPADSDHLVLGNDGGVYVSHDRSRNWVGLKNLPLGQFYAIAVDLRRPYRVYGGLQDNGSWGGPSATRSLEGVTAADWFRIYAGDGFHCAVDPADADVVYAEMQYGGLIRANVRTGSVKEIKPAAPRGAPAYRFNWSSPLVLSPHNPRTLYYGGNHVFRSVDRGDAWEEISPDLTRGKPGPSAYNGHTLTTLAESPRTAGLLWAGSDDGRVHVRRPGGSWTEVSERLPGVPSERWITRVEASRFAEGTAYVALDRHRNDDCRPYLFRTTDHGATWQSLSSDLPAGSPVHVIREGLRNKELLFAGLEHGLWVSLDGGTHWQRLRAGMPAVPIHDLVVHPRDGDLVIGTHGRSIYVLDISPLEELTKPALAEPAWLCDVKPALQFAYRGSRRLGDSRLFAAPNPPYGAAIWYHLREKPKQPVRLTIADALGNVVATLKGAEQAGLHRAQWNLRVAGVATSQAGPAVLPGDYVVRLEVGERTQLKKLRVEAEE